jgi:hypothetical protein
MVDKRRFDSTQAAQDPPLRALFVRSRRVVRLVSDDGETFELPLNEFLQRLGVDPADLVPPRHYVVFAGTEERPAGGAGDIAGTFGTEDEGRALFQRLRASPDHRWAQLVSLDARGRARAVCWFGDKFRAGATAASTDTGESGRRRVRRRLSVIAGGQGRDTGRDGRSRPA